MKTPARRLRSARDIVEEHLIRHDISREEYVDLRTALDYITGMCETEPVTADQPDWIWRPAIPYGLRAPIDSASFLGLTKVVNAAGINNVETR